METAQEEQSSIDRACRPGAPWCPTAQPIAAGCGLPGAASAPQEGSTVLWSKPA